MNVQYWMGKTRNHSESYSALKQHFDEHPEHEKDARGIFEKAKVHYGKADSRYTPHFVELLLPFFRENKHARILEALRILESAPKKITLKSALDRIQKQYAYADLRDSHPESAGQWIERLEPRNALLAQTQIARLKEQGISGPVILRYMEAYLQNPHTGKSVQTSAAYGLRQLQRNKPTAQQIERAITRLQEGLRPSEAWAKEKI